MTLLTHHATARQYEQERLTNIQANNALLAKLGLFREPEKNVLIKAPANVAKTTQVPNRRRERRGSDATNAPKRRSRRLKGLEPPGAPERTKQFHADDKVTTRVASDMDRNEEAHRVARLQVANALADSLHTTENRQPGTAVDRILHPNDTASYAHCLMRVKSMSEKALRRRINVMERAAGRWCVVKMAVFVRCLEVEGCSALAVEAQASLDRLKAMRPVPTAATTITSLDDLS